MKDVLYSGEIEMGHARAMLTLSESQQKMLLAEMLARKYSVRQIEARVKQLQTTPDLPRDCARVFEIVTPQPDVLQSTRRRYAAYRERELEPQTHRLGKP